MSAGYVLSIALGAGITATVGYEAALVVSAVATVLGALFGTGAVRGLRDRVAATAGVMAGKFSLLKDRRSVLLTVGYMRQVDGFFELQIAQIIRRPIFQRRAVHESVNDMRDNAQTSLRVEPACRQFDVCTDSERTLEVFLYERYDNADAFQNHLKSDHFRAFNAAVADMIESKHIATYGTVE